MNIPHAITLIQQERLTLTRKMQNKNNISIKTVETDTTLTGK